MKRLTKSLVILGAMAVGNATADMVDIAPYIGVDYYQVWMKGRNDWNLVFPRTYPGVTGYVGTKFHENFGVELGYDWTSRRVKHWTLSSGSTFFGNVIPVGQGLTGTTSIRRAGGHFDVLAFLPIAECLELLGSAGFGWIQTKITSSFNVAPGVTNQSSALASVSGEGRGVFRLGIGVAYMVTGMVGVRGKVSFESTSNLRVKGNALFTSLGYDTHAFKGTTAVAVGAFVKF